MYRVNIDLVKMLLKIDDIGKQQRISILKMAKLQHGQTLPVNISKMKGIVDVLLCDRLLIIPDNTQAIAFQCVSTAAADDNNRYIGVKCTKLPDRFQPGGTFQILIDQDQIKCTAAVVGEQLLTAGIEGQSSPQRTVLYQHLQFLHAARCRFAYCDT